jgi:hypothetical protein
MEEITAILASQFGMWVPIVSSLLGFAVILLLLKLIRWIWERL